MSNIHAAWCILILFLSCLLPLTAAAQNTSNGSVTGSIIDETTKLPVEYANVGLYHTADSSLVKGVVSAKKSGVFEIAGLNDGAYYLRITRLGYRVKKTSSFKIDAGNAHPALGAIAMAEKMVTLDEVLVTGRKELQNNSIDRKVYNVDQDVMSKSGSASEVLQNIPSVQIDIDGNVSLRGSADVMILINGKNSSMMDRNRAEALQQLNAGDIERVEVITNPSSKFQPDGTSGIINIVLKKNTATGLNGSVSVNVGNQNRYNGSIRLNYHPGAFNFYGGYSFRHDNRHRNMSITVGQRDSAGILTNYREDLTSVSSPISHSVNLGFDADAGDGTSFGASGNYWHNNFTATDHAVNVYQDSTGTQMQGFDRDRYDNEFQEDYGFRFYVQHQYPEKDKTLRLDYSFAGHPEQEDNHFTNINWFPPAPSQFNNTQIHPLTNRNQLSVDFSDPLDEHSKLEAGYAGQDNHNDFNYLITTFDTAQSALITDLSKTSRFKYDEIINAVYVTYEHSFGAFGMLAGVRAEQEHSIANMVTTDSVITRNYFNFYPTVHLSYKIADEHEFQLSYSRRVHRPQTEDLNPFPEYRDPRNPVAGNAGMLPEYIHSVEFGYSYQNEVISFIPSIYYRYISNRFTRVYTALDDSTLLMTQTNLANNQTGGLEIILGANLGEVFSSHASVNIYSDQVDASNLGYGTSSTVVSWNGALSLSAHITKQTMLQMNANYNGYRMTPQGQTLPSFVVNMGGRQEFLENKLFLTLTVSDIFHSFKRQSTVNTAMLNRTWVDSRDGGVIYVGLAYNFGIANKAAKKDQLQFEEGQ